MQTITIQRTQVNIEALDASLRDALGGLYLGLSTRNGDVLVHVTDAAGSAGITQVQQIVTAHDPAQLTPQQQERLQLRQRLSAARAAEQDTEFDNTLLDALDPLMKKLARRVYWLEQEIRDLRNLT